MATIQKQGDGKYSVKIGNQKFNGLSQSEAQRRADINYQVAPDSVTDSKNQKARNLQLGIKPGDSNAMRDSAIRGESLQNSSLIQLPQPAPVKNEMGTIMGANASVVNPAMGVTTGENGLLQYTAPQTGTTAENTFQSYLNSLQSLQTEAPSASDTYDRLYRESGLKNIDRDIQNYTSQINNITAKAQAESLALEGQGRGITESIIGGQQAQISREAAIQALPLQALLANAQGNKELAMTHLDTRFKLQMEDAQNKYNYKLKVIDAVYQFADKQEQRQLEERQREEDRAFELKKADIAFERQKYMENLGFANSKALRQMDIDNGTSAGGDFKDSQILNAGFAVRIEESDKIISSLENMAVKPIGYLEKNLPNIFKSEDRQKLEQAQRNFINAVLRKESGAVISDEEFANARQQYIPQVGDKPETLAQKAANRNDVLNTYKTGAGGAYNEIKSNTTQDTQSDPLDLTEVVKDPLGLFK